MERLEPKQRERGAVEVRGTIEADALRSLATFYLPLAAVCGFAAALSMQCALGIGYAAEVSLPWRLCDAAVWAMVFYVPVARLSRSTSWLSFDGATVRAKLLLTRGYIEKPLSAVVALEKVTIGQCGELEGRRIRFADGSCLAFALSGYSHAGQLLASIEEALTC